jgi:hypothetical protein
MTSHFPLPKTAEEMLAEARQLTGIDLFDEAALKPLSVLVDSFNNEGGFTEVGALAKHDYLMRFLKNRLRMQRDIAAHPEILDIEVKAPIIINALARTGSTKLQKVLSMTGDFNWLPMWQVLNPASWSGKPNEDVSDRVKDIEAFIAWHRTASPQSQAAHAMIIDAPEESSSIMMHSLISSTLTGYANAPSYVEWSFTQDQSIQFEYVQKTMQYLIWQGLADANKPFVLKSAMSVGFEDGLMTAHGAPHLLMTHRDPRNCIPSTCKLIEVFRLAYSDQKVDHSGLIPGLTMLLQMHMDFRDRRPDVPIMDINYRDLAANAPAVVEAIYSFCKIEPGPAAIENVRKWEARNPKNRHGAFEYTLEEFGITGDGILDAFSAYIAMLEKKGLKIIAH